MNFSKLIAQSVLQSIPSSILPSVAGLQLNTCICNWFMCSNVYGVNYLCWYMKDRLTFSGGYVRYLNQSSSSWFQQRQHSSSWSSRRSSFQLHSSSSRIFLKPVKVSLMRLIYFGAVFNRERLLGLLSSKVKMCWVYDIVGSSLLLFALPAVGNGMMKYFLQGADRFLFVAIYT